MTYLGPFYALNPPEYKRTWYHEGDVKSCAHHSEAKELANKLYRKWCSLSDKFCDTAMSKDADFTDQSVFRKFMGMSDKIDKVEIEWNNVRRGLMKCCAVH